METEAPGSAWGTCNKLLSENMHREEAGKALIHRAPEAQVCF